jgi:hypothetical protein
MVKIKNLLIALILVIIAVGAAILLFPSEDKKVKKQFALLSERISKEPGENTFTMAQKVKSLGTLFTEKCELKEPIHSLSGSYTREEITSLALQGRAYFYSLSLKFQDLDISFPGEGSAKVILVARLSGKSTLGEYVDEMRELVCLLKRIEKKWLFSQIEAVEVLRR